MKKYQSMSLAALLVLSFSLTGCGDDSDSGDSDGGSSGVDTPIVAGDDSENGGVDAPIVAYSCEESMSYGGQTVTLKLGANGNLTCDDSYGYIELAFANGVNEMVVSQITSTTSFDSSYGSGSGTINYQEGTETIIGTDDEHGSVNCTNTYDIPLPLHIYDAEEFEYLSIYNYQRIDTDCPDWVNDDSDDYDDDIGSFTYSENITITETSGTVSEVSLYQSFQ